MRAYRPDPSERSTPTRRLTKGFGATRVRDVGHSTVASCHYGRSTFDETFGGKEVAMAFEQSAQIRSTKPRIESGSAAGMPVICFEGPGP